jgi:hypothetical protein
MIKLSHKGKAVEKQTKITMLTQADEKDLFKPRQIVPLSAERKCPLGLGLIG